MSEIEELLFLGSFYHLFWALMGKHAEEIGFVVYSLFIKMFGSNYIIFYLIPSAS